MGRGRGEGVDCDSVMGMKYNDTRKEIDFDSARNSSVLRKWKKLGRLNVQVYEERLHV